MTDIETQDGRSDNVPDMIVRTFEATLTAGDGRTVDVRIVPYGERATIYDGHGGSPRGVPYQEEWMPGVFAHQTNAANRVLANFEHQSGLAGVVGHGIALREASDGFHGSFKLHDTPDGDKALMLVSEKVLDGISLEAHVVKSVRSGGVVQRIKAHLRAVALTRNPAFTGAQVLAVREEILFDEEMLPVELNPEVVERCRRLGIKLPQRYQAHPEETDTPDKSGTSEDGTRQPQTNTSQEGSK
jgi:HK97 family phage prohead protease